MKLNVLEEIVAYQVANRQVGHTYAMLDGVDYRKNSFIVTANVDHRKNIIRELERRGWHGGDADQCVITISQIKMGFLKQVKGRPLVIDNFALFEIAVELAEDRKKLMIELNKREAESRK